MSPQRVLPDQWRAGKPSRSCSGSARPDKCASVEQVTVEDRSLEVRSESSGRWRLRLVSVRATGPVAARVFEVAFQLNARAWGVVVGDRLQQGRVFLG